MKSEIVTTRDISKEYINTLKTDGMEIIKRLSFIKVAERYSSFDNNYFSLFLDDIYDEREESIKLRSEEMMQKLQRSILYSKKRPGNEIIPYNHMGGIIDTVNTYGNNSFSVKQKLEIAKKFTKPIIYSYVDFECDFEVVKLCKCPILPEITTFIVDEAEIEIIYTTMKVYKAFHEPRKLTIEGLFTLKIDPNKAFYITKEAI